MVKMTNKREMGITAGVAPRVTVRPTINHHAGPGVVRHRPVAINLTSTVEQYKRVLNDTPISSVTVIVSINYISNF